VPKWEVHAFPGNRRIHDEQYGSGRRHSQARFPNKPIKRAKFLEHFANRARCLIGMEACGGAHHWARQLIKMGHDVKLIPAEFAKAFNIRNKSDAADARAIWLAVQQPGKPVAVKTETQQAMLALHRMRQQLIKFRTMQVNNLRRGDGQEPCCA
jgi:transposase